MLMNRFHGAARLLMAAMLTAALAVPATLLTPSVAEAAQSSQQKTSQKKTTQKKASTAKKQTAKKTTGKKKTSTAKKAAVAAPVVLSAAEIAAQQRRAGPDLIESHLDVPLAIESRAALISNARTGEVLYAKNVHQSMPIASITKLMTAMIVLDAGLDLNDPITITEADVDHLRHTHSRLSVGTTLTRADMLLLALMASENRAASALARTYPGGLSAALDAMNRKARSLGMPNTHFYDGTGLHGGNVSTPGELTKMVQAAYRYPDIRAFSTMPSYQVTSRGQVLQYNNTNGLVKKPEWDIGVSKTGFINEAGRCLVMMAHIEDMPVVIVLMDSWGKYTRIGDANRVKKWLEVALRS